MRGTSETMKKDVRLESGAEAAALQTLTRLSNVSGQREAFGVRRL